MRTLVRFLFPKHSKGNRPPDIGTDQARTSFCYNGGFVKLGVKGSIEPLRLLLLFLTANLSKAKSTPELLDWHFAVMMGVLAIPVLTPVIHCTVRCTTFFSFHMGISAGIGICRWVAASE